VFTKQNETEQIKKLYYLYS